MKKQAVGVCLTSLAAYLGSAPQGRSSSAPLLVGPMSPLGEGGALFPPHCQRVEVEQTRSLRGKKKRQIGWIFKLLLCCTPPGPTRAKQVPVAPRSGMQVHTPGVIPSKPRIFLTDLGSLELSSRGKGTEKTCVWRCINFNNIVN